MEMQSIQMHIFIRFFNMCTYTKADAQLLHVLD